MRIVLESGVSRVKWLMEAELEEIRASSLPICGSAMRFEPSGTRSVFVIGIWPEQCPKRERNVSEQIVQGVPAKSSFSGETQFD